jgi:hypothetical protein
MGEGFPLLWACAGALAMFGLDWLHHFDLCRLRSMLPPLLLFGGWCLRDPLTELALRCQGAVYNSAPLQFFNHALRLPFS